MADEKRRAGRDLPFLNWRYILFVWNDSDEEMDAGAAAGGRDRRRSPVLGDHRSSRERVFAALRPRVGRVRGHPPRDLGRQQPRQRDSRRDAAGANRRAARWCPARRSSRARDQPLRGPHARRTISRRVRFPRRRPTAAGSCASARSSARPTARSSTAISRARGCRNDIGPGDERRRRRPRFRRSPTPGRYALKFDLVSEGVDWFERCGSRRRQKQPLVGADRGRRFRPTDVVSGAAGRG